MIQFDSNLLQPIIYLAALLYGGKAFFNKKSPLYFKLFLFGVGCFFLEALYYTVDFLCNGAWSWDFNFACFGAGGCFAFMCSANYGLFDGIVDDGSKSALKARQIGIIAPVTLAVILLLGILGYINNSGSVLTIVIVLVSKIFAFPAAYFHLKHLVLKDDLNFMVSALRPFNASALAVILLDFVSTICYGLLWRPGVIVTAWALPVALLVMMITAEKGCKKWTI